MRRLILVLLLGFTLASCNRSSRVEPATHGQALTLGNGEEPKDLDTNTQTSMAEFILDSALYEGLVNLSNDGHTILPGVAERWEVSPDGRTYTFHLRADARWSDGAPVTAHDFVFSFQRVFTPNLMCSNSVMGFAIQGAENRVAGKKTELGVLAPDDRTVVIKLNYRAPYFLYIISMSPFLAVPQHVVEKFGGDTQANTAWTKPGNLVGNGPFVLSAWHPNQDIIMTLNPHYWDRARVKLTSLRFMPTDDTNAEERSFRTGTLHVTYSIPNSKLETYHTEPASRLHINPLLSTGYLSFNTSAPPFNDVRVRRALALALDREHIIPRVLHEMGTPAHALTRPGTGGYTPPVADDYNPAEARRLLAEAGYPGGVGFPVVTLSSTSSHPTVLPEALQEAWRKELGLTVSLHSEELKTFLDNLHSQNYQVALTSYTYGINAPELMLQISLSDSNWNYTALKDGILDHAYLDANQATDDAGRFAAFDRMEKQLTADAAFVPLYFNNQAFLVSPAVHGWKDNSVQQIDWRELSLAP